MCRLGLEPPSCWVYSGKTAATSGSPSATRSTRRLVTIWTWTTPMLTLSTIAEKITYATISLVSFCECWPYRVCDGGVQSPKSEQNLVIATFWRCDDVYQPGVELFMRTVGGSCKNITKVICLKKGCLLIQLGPAHCQKILIIITAILTTTSLQFMQQRGTLCFAAITTL